MSVTAIAVFAVFFLGLILAFIAHPIYALFSYLWIFYNHPPAFWWGADVPQLRYALFAALITFVSSLRLHEARSAPWIGNGGAKLIVAYAVWMWCQVPWAVNPEAHLEGAILWTKYVMLYYIIYTLVADAKRIELFLWAHIAGCLIFGWVAYTSNVSGRLETVGGPGVDDSNLFAAHMITGLAVAGFMFLGLRGYRRWAAFLIIPFVLNAIILTQSRGAFLALICAAPVAWYLAPKTQRRFVSVAIVLGAVLFLTLSNEELWERTATLYGAEARPTEETRISLLGPQLKMFIDHPFGAGHGGNEVLSTQYMPTELLAAGTGRRSAHNTFMAVLVDQGIPGAAILVGLYFWVGASLIKLKRLDTQGLPPLLGIFRAAIGTALFSYFVTGLFLNLLKAETQIWFIALLASLTVICNSALKGANSHWNRTLKERADG